MKTYMQVRIGSEIGHTRAERDTKINPLQVSNPLSGQPEMRLRVLNAKRTKIGHANNDAMK